MHSRNARTEAGSGESREFCKFSRVLGGIASRYETPIMKHRHAPSLLDPSDYFVLTLSSSLSSSVTPKEQPIRGKRISRRSEGICREASLIYSHQFTTPVRSDVQLGSNESTPAIYRYVYICMYVSRYRIYKTRRREYTLFCPIATALRIVCLRRRTGELVTESRARL